MLGGHICCGRYSTHPECKGLEINAFDVNFGNASFSKAEIAAEGKHRAGFTRKTKQDLISQNIYDF